MSITFHGTFYRALLKPPNSSRQEMMAAIRCHLDKDLAPINTVQHKSSEDENYLSKD